MQRGYRKNDQNICSSFSLHRRIWIASMQLNNNLDCCPPMGIQPYKTLILPGRQTTLYGNWKAATVLRVDRPTRAEADGQRLASISIFSPSRGLHWILLLPAESKMLSNVHKTYIELAIACGRLLLFRAGIWIVIQIRGSFVLYWSSASILRDCFSRVG